MPLFRESVSITSRLLGNIRKTVPADIAIFAFGSDNNEPFYSEFHKLSEKHEINFIDGIPQAVAKFEKKGKLARFDGSHWNDRGHAIVAQKLGEYLKMKLNDRINN